MKRIVLLFPLLGLLFLFSCEKENTGLSDGFVKNQSIVPYSVAGELHNEGMDFIKTRVQNDDSIKALLNTIDINGQLTLQDTLLVMNIVNDLALEFLLQADKLSTLQVTSDFISTNCQFSNAELLDLYRHDPSSSVYPIQFESLVKRLQKGVDQEYLNWLADKESEIFDAQIIDSLKTPLLVTFSVASQSAVYFLEYTDSSKAYVGYGTVMGDIEGAYGGAVAGGVFGGPIGAVAVGTAGALIGSSTGFMLDQLWDRIWD